MGHPVNWFQISGRTGEGIQKFYKEVFKWKMKVGPGGMAMVQPDKGGIPGGIGASQDGKASVAIYIDVANIDEQLERITAAGGRVAMPKMELPDGMGSIAGFLDPEQNWVGLWQQAAKPRRRAPVKKAAPAKKAPAKKAPAKKGKAAAKKPAPRRR